MQNVMQKQSDPLNLQSLPLVSPPRDGWPAIEAALRQDRRRRVAARYAGAALAAAATVIVVLGLLLQQPVTVPSSELPQQSLTLAQKGAEHLPGQAADAGLSATAETLDALIALSQRLEVRLRSIRSGLGDLPASAVVYQIELEDLVVQVDEQLSSQPDSLSLWNQRVSLLMDIERLYESSMRREYQQMASL